MRTKGIYVGVLNQGELRVELAATLNELARQGKYTIRISYSAKKPISHNRNAIVRAFLKVPQFDYLMMVDDDIIPPLKILELADYQEDIIGALTFCWPRESIVPLILQENKKGSFNVMDFKGDEGLIECDAVGTGCIMIKREVLAHPYWQQSGGWFRDEFDNTGDKITGLDLAFCRRAKKLGFKVFAHLDYPCSHWVTMDLKHIYASLLEAGEKDKKVSFHLREKVSKVGQPRK